MRDLNTRIVMMILIGLISGCATLTPSPNAPSPAPVSDAVLLNQGIDFYYAGQYEEAVDALVSPAMNGDSEAQYYLGLLFDQSATEDADFEQARMWYEQAASNNHPAALNNLGVIYDKGLGVDKNRGQAAEYFRAAALRGYARAQTNLGVMLINGRGLEKDLDGAIYWFSLAAANEESDAMINLGYIAESGMSGVVNFADAVHWYSQAMANEDINAYYRLAKLYSDGNGVELDQFKASSLYYEAAALGHMASQMELWHRYRDGNGFQRDINEALGWLQRAADQGSPEAQLTLGKSYLFGRHNKQADDLALYWIYTAAEAGVMEAQAYLAYIFENGIGIEKNKKQAYALYRHVAGFDNSFAQLGVARLLADKDLELPNPGYGDVWLERAVLGLKIKAATEDWESNFLLAELHSDKNLGYYDIVKAAEYYTVAMQSGQMTVASERLIALTSPAVEIDTADTSAEQNSLQLRGFEFLKDNAGKDGNWPLDTEEAVAIFERAANQGSVTAQADLGIMYQYGAWVQQDFHKAHEWYSMAANQDSAIAQYGLGEIYMLGQGVNLDVSEANRWFVRAFDPLHVLADDGDKQAQLRLGKMFTYGYGVERDYITAYDWLIRSQAAGSAQAGETIAELELFMNQVRRFVGVKTAYVRDNPGTHQPVVETLVYGAEVLELERQGSWVKINFNGGNATKGWVYSPLITAQLEQHQILGRH